MSGTRPPLAPEADERGLAGGDPAQVAELVSVAWTAGAQLAARLPLDAPSRLDGWTVRDVLVHLGSWEEHRTFATLFDDARHDRVHEVDDVDARNAHVVAAHHDASAAEIVAALEAARDRALEFFAAPDARSIGRAWTDSGVGPLPVGAVVLGSAFELAVHALDITSPDDVPPGLLDAGVAALVDLAGALAARRGLRATVAVVTPIGCWVTGAAGGAWSTMALPPGTLARDLGWPAVEGRAHDVLDAAAGRRLGAQLVATRSLRLYDLGGLLRLTSALDAVPGLPGGSALHAAAQALAQTGRMLSRLGGALRRRG